MTSAARSDETSTDEGGEPSWLQRAHNDPCAQQRCAPRNAKTQVFLRRNEQVRKSAGERGPSACCTQSAPFVESRQKDGTRNDRIRRFIRGGNMQWRDAVLNS